MTTEPKAPGKGTSRSAVQRRKRAQAKAGWELVQKHHALQRAMPIVRRRANELRRVRRDAKIKKQAALRERERKFVMSRSSTRSMTQDLRGQEAAAVAKFNAGEFKPVIEA